MPEVKITDHAVVRYIERVMGVDIDKLKEEILPTNLRVMALKEDCKITLDGYRLVIKDNAVVTVTAKEPK